MSTEPSPPCNATELPPGLFGATLSTGVPGIRVSAEPSFRLA